MSVSEKTAVGKEHDKLLEEFRTAIGDDLSTFALLHSSEPDAKTLAALKQVGFPTNLGLNLQSESAIAVIKAMADTIAALPDPPDEKCLDDLAADFAQIYLTHAVRAAPMESVWLDKDHLVRQQPMFKVRGYYRRYGLKVADWANQPDDHLVSELHFLSHLFLASDREESLRDAASFLDEHLLRWVDRFAAQVSRRCETDYFAGLCVLTASYLDGLRDVMAELLGEPRPSLEEKAEQNDTADLARELDLPLPSTGPESGPTW